MSQKKKIRSDQEWLELIRECRTSGLSVRNWCQMRSISIKTFYNKVLDLRKKSFDIPGSQSAPSGQEHEVVPLEMAASPVLYPDSPDGDAVQAPPARAASRSGYPGTALKLQTAPQTAPQKTQYGIRFWRWGSCVRRIVR